MAAVLSRSQWCFFKKNRLNLARLIIIFDKDRYTQLRNVYSQQRSEKINGRSIKSILTYTTLITGLGYIYKKRNDLFERFNNLLFTIPTVYAESFSMTEVSHNRNKYNFIADVVEMSAPSVVYIEIKDQKGIDFFTGKPGTASNGSGFIVGSDGLILTNAHVVINKPHTAIMVRLQDGSTYSGIVEDIDIQSDLATVRIKKTNLPVMKLGSSANIRPGEFVVAIGSPLSLSNTITSGVVSSTNRQSQELGLHNKHMDYIQTDAAITFGNSGGPLVNLDGEAIGINAMKVTAGISFAIPIDYAKEFLKRAEARRKNKGVQNVLEAPKRRYMGITMLTLTPDILFEIQQKSGMMIKHGVLVWKVVIGSPAYRSGLRAGDAITHVNGEPIVAAFNIYKVLEKSGSIKLTVVRKKEVLHITVDPEEI